MKQPDDEEFPPEHIEEIDSNEGGPTRAKEREQGEGERYLSLKWIVVALCGLGIVASVGASIGVFQKSCDDALGKTRRNSKDSNEQCFQLAVDNLEEKSGELLKYGTAAIRGRLDDYFALFIAEGAKFSEQFRTIDEDQDLCNFLHFYSIRHRMVFDAIYLNTRGMALKGVICEAAMLVYMVIPTFGPMYYRNFGIDELDTHAGQTNVTGVFRNDFGQIAISAKDDFAVKALRDGVVGNETLWSNLYSIGDFMGVALVSILFDPVSEKNLMAFVSLSLPKVDEFLREIAQDMEATSSAAVIRIFSTVSTSLLSKRYTEKGPGYEAQAAQLADTDKLTGVSHGIAAQSFTNAGSALPSVTPLFDIEADDLLIRQLAWAIHNRTDGYEGIFKEGKVVQLDTDGNGTHFVHVSKLNDSYGLDWWLTTTVDHNYILSEVEALKVSTLKDIDASTKDITETIDKDRDIGYIIVTCVSVLLGFLSFGLVRLLLRPLDALKVNMSQVADMNLDNTSSLVPSRLQELSTMQTAFQQMVANLKEYRAYVPIAILDTGGKIKHTEPPTGIVTIVFTDIENSTQLWNKSSAGMNQAIELHNNIMREACDEHNGYEVKTIGDAFMVAFTSTVDGLNFCLTVQTKLAQQQWSPELELPACFTKKNDRTPLWNGIRVRMGCHTGDAILEENPLTNRADYRGSTINKAARLEGKAKGGTICVAKDVYETIKSKDSELGSPSSCNHGYHELKGLGSDHELFLISPTCLADRLSKSGTVLAEKYAPGTLTNFAGNVSYTEGSAMSEREGGDYDLVSSNCGKASRRSEHHPVVQNPKTGLSLYSDQVTVAVCRLLDCSRVQLFDNCNTMVRVVVEAAGQTDGVVGNVTGRTMTIMWNASKPCKLHTTAALRFAAQLERRAGGVMRVGIATGDMLYGNVGTVKRRFHTTFGRPLEAAEAAADHALQLGAFCLLSDCTLECRLSANPAISPFVRIVDIWMDSDTERQILMMELMTTKLMTQLEDAWGMPGGSDTELEKHNARVVAAIGGDKSALEELKQACAMHSSDTVLVRTFALLSSITEHHPTHRVAVTFTNLPDGVLSSLASLGPLKSPAPTALRARRLSHHSVSPPPGAFTSPMRMPAPSMHLKLP